MLARQTDITIPRYRRLRSRDARRTRLVGEMSAVRLRLCPSPSSVLHTLGALPPRLIARPEISGWIGSYLLRVTAKERDDATLAAQLLAAQAPPRIAARWLMLGALKGRYVEGRLRCVVALPALFSRLGARRHTEVATALAQVARCDRSRQLRQVALSILQSKPVNACAIIGPTG
jgi:hypothetical protein